MGFILQDASTGGSGGNSSATAISSATSTNSSAWGTAQNVSFTATGQTLSLPTPIAGDIAPVLKTIVITNTGTNPFTVALTGGTITSAVGFVMNPGTIWTITAQTLTTANVSATNAAQGVIPEFGENNAIVSQALTAAFVDVTGGSIPLPSAGTWAVDAIVSFATANNFGRIQITDNLGVVVPNSISTTGSSVDGNQLAQAHSQAVITITSAATYKLQVQGTSAAGSTQNSVANGQSKITWRKISGAVPVTGQSVDLKDAYVSTPINVASIIDVVFQTSGNGNIPYNNTTGVFTLTAGKVYELESMLSIVSNVGTAVNGNIKYQWVDAITNSPLYTGQPVGFARIGNTTTASLENSSDVPAIATYTPATNQTVKVRAMVVTLGGASQLAILGTGNSSGSFAKIRQLGSSAITTTVRAQVRANTMTGVASASPGTAITFVNKELDTTNSFTAATGVFIAPRTGQYQINAQFFVGTSAVGSGGRFGVILSTNGAAFGVGSPIITYFAPVTNPLNAVFGGSYVKTLNAGDSLTFRAFLDNATSMVLAGNANFDYITITELNPTF